MDILVKIERFQIKPNVINLKSTLLMYILSGIVNSTRDIHYTVKPRFWNTFAAKILLINRFFATDQKLVQVSIVAL